MSNLVDSILARLETLLRYIAPGFVALFVLSLTLTDFTPLTTTQNGGYPPWVIIVAAALMGVIIYAIHTSVLVRCLWGIVVYIHLHCSKHLWKPNDRSKTARDIMWDLDTARWKRRGTQDPEISAVQRELDKWSALLNYTYCSSYPMIFIPLCIRKIQPDQISHYWICLVASGIILLVFALISDYLITKRELWANKTYPYTNKEASHLGSNPDY